MFFITTDNHFLTVNVNHVVAIECVNDEYTLVKMLDGTVYKTHDSFESITDQFYDILEFMHERR